MSDLPTNREVRLPEPLETSEESKLLSFKVEVLESVKKYIQENCSESGRQEVLNLSNSLRRNSLIWISKSFNISLIRNSVRNVAEI